MALAAYIHVGALSVMIWDILNHSKKDFSLLFLYEFSQHVALYAAARYMTFIYVASKTVFLAVQMPRCDSLNLAISAFYMLALTTTLLQLSIRLWILLGKKRNMLTFFGALWFLAIGGNIALAAGVAGRSSLASLGPGDGAGAITTDGTTTADGACVDHIRGAYVPLAFIVLVVYHACMLVTVGLAIRQNVSADRESLTVMERYERMVRGASSLFLVQPLTLDDRIFHISATALSLTSMIWFFATSMWNAGASLRLALVAVYIVSTNILMGRVFRNSVLPLGSEQHGHSLTPPAIGTPRSLKFTPHTRHTEVRTKKNLRMDQPSINRVVKLDADGYDSVHRTQLYDGDPRASPVLQVEVQRVTEYKHDFSSVESDSHSEEPCETARHMFV